MALIKDSNLVGLPQVTVEDLKSSDPARLNRIIRLLASQIKSVQTGISSASTITNVTTEFSGGGSSSSSSGASTSTIVTIQGTHAQRLADHLPSSQPAGSYYYETDRTVTYLNFLAPSTEQVWQYASGTMRALMADRPADLGTYDAGFIFYATDENLLFEWDGTAWSQYTSIDPVLQDTYANWTAANYPPDDYTPGTLFVVTDRNWIYSVQVVTAANTWVFVDGEYGAATASRPTTGFNGVALGTNDTGMRFVDTTLKVIERWSGAAWVQLPDVPATATVLASNSDKQIIAAALLNTKIYIGSASDLPVAQTIGLDATLAANGDLKVTGANGAAIPASQSVIGTNSSGQFVPGSAAGATTGTWTPALTFGGGSTGITYAVQSGNYWKFSGLVVATFDILLTAVGSSTGIAEIAGLPFSVSASEIISGSVIYGLDLAGLTSTPTILPELGTTVIAAYNWGATGAANMTEANFTNTSRFIGTVIYYS